MLTLVFQICFAVVYISSVVGFKHQLKSHMQATRKKGQYSEGDAIYYFMAAFWPIVGLLSLAYDGFLSIRSASKIK